MPKPFRAQGQKQGKKPQEDILSRLDYFESSESEISLKLAPRINGLIEVKITYN